ncbi:MAG TPA: RluA family pseudouridine synthase [Thermohalobaculum sp.]|nr:RluA family pseudouridine synthase [Thermohalobaculum sp.]
MADLPDGDDAPLELTVPDALAGERLDKALAELAAGIPGLSRSRIVRLIAEGAVSGEAGETVTEARRKVKPGETFTLEIPPPVPIAPEPEAIPLTILYEDAELIVIDKPAGMVVHPAPGAERGTLVNALLHHCGATLGGIGGARRPGIVHRIDKDTSGVLVVAKSEAAHAGLSALFAARAIERRYLALLWGAPERAEARLAGLPGVSFEPGGWLRIEAAIARHPGDRKRMAVLARGRHAVTRLRVLERFGQGDATGDTTGARPFASLAECRLETGRTHQIRVHAAHVGHPLIGDPVYGRPRAPSAKRAAPGQAAALAAFPRQALHAASLGFRHPVSGAPLFFEAPPPPDLRELVAILGRNPNDMR